MVLDWRFKVLDWKFELEINLQKGFKVFSTWFKILGKIFQSPIPNFRIWFWEVDYFSDAQTTFCSLIVIFLVFKFKLFSTKFRWEFKFLFTWNSKKSHKVHASKRQVTSALEEADGNRRPTLLEKHAALVSDGPAAFITQGESPVTVDRKDSPSPAKDKPRVLFSEKKKTDQELVTFMLKKNFMHLPRCEFWLKSGWKFLIF